jgi:hypothetical protein
MTGKSVPGEGSRFKALEKKLEKSGKSKKSAQAIAAAIGRKKYGPKDMSQASAAGRKGTVHRMTRGGK